MILMPRSLNLSGHAVADLWAGACGNIIELGEPKPDDVVRKQSALQSRSFNRTGRARTLDHELPATKTWAERNFWARADGKLGQRLCYRQVLEVELPLAGSWPMRWKELQGIKPGPRDLRLACPGATCKAQAQSCQKVSLEPADEPLRFFICNLMFDAFTFELKVGKDAAASCSVLCSHAQWAMGSNPVWSMTGLASGMNTSCAARRSFSAHEFCDDVENIV